jgi:uncharacterized protein YndB with AHSA1/START domain
MTDPLKLTITRTFDAPRDLVFSAWTAENRVGAWAPKDFAFVSFEGDLQVGGNWRAAMRGPDGVVHVNGGVYREIARPERLVMTHGWQGEDGRIADDTLITLTFTEAGAGRTTMHFEQTGFGSEADRDGHGTGWDSAFDVLGEELAKAT